MVEYLHRKILQKVEKDMGNGKQERDSEGKREKEKEREVYLEEGMIQVERSMLNLTQNLGLDTSRHFLGDLAKRS